MTHLRARSVSRSTIEGGMLKARGHDLFILVQLICLLHIIMNIIDACRCQFLMQAEMGRDDLWAREGST